MITAIIDSRGKDRILAFTLPLGDTDNGHSWDSGSGPIGAGSVVFNVMFKPSRNLGHLGKSIKCQVSIQMHVLFQTEKMERLYCYNKKPGKKDKVVSVICHIRG